MRELFLQPQTPGQDTREYTYQMIRQNLLELILPPHTQLSEAMMAQMLGVSRTPVHDAFARLDEEGLMCAVPQKGTMVAPISANRVQQGIFMKVHLGRAVMEQVCRTGFENDMFFELESSFIEGLRESRLNHCSCHINYSPFQFLSDDRSNAGYTTESSQDPGYRFSSSNGKRI